MSVNTTKKKKKNTKNLILKIIVYELIFKIYASFNIHRKKNRIYILTSRFRYVI